MKMKGNIKIKKGQNTRMLALEFSNTISDAWISERDIDFKNNKSRKYQSQI